MPWWANLAWCGLFLMWFRLGRPAVWLGALGLIPRMLTVAGTVGTVWMLSGLAWFSVMAFYAMTALWPVLLWLLARHKASGLATWMVPLAALEGVGAVGALAGMVTGTLLGSPRLEARPAAAAAFAVGQVFFLFRIARTA